MTCASCVGRVERALAAVPGVTRAAVNLASGRATVLAQIIRLVEQAQGAKLPIQARVDRITMWFVPVVMGLALLTFAAWWAFGPSPALTFALVNAVAVLIIACPCAMGLATPTSIMVGSGRGAELGVLFRKGEALQLLKEAAVVAVDKTGTLTEGRPLLTDLHVAGGFARGPVLAQVAAVEDRSEHPIARAIVNAAQEEGLALPQVQAFESVTGFTACARRWRTRAWKWARTASCADSGWMWRRSPPSPRGSAKKAGRRCMPPSTAGSPRSSPSPIRSSPVPSRPSPACMRWG